MKADIVLYADDSTPFEAAETVSGWYQLTSRMIYLIWDMGFETSFSPLTLGRPKAY